MTPQNTPKSVLVLLVGEVLGDPRVLRTCRSLAKAGAKVTVGCTNPDGRPARESVDGIDIIRFEHHRESSLKRLYNSVIDRVHPAAGQRLSRIHGDVPRSKAATFLRNLALTANHRHVMKHIRAVNRLMVREFSTGEFDLVHANDVTTIAAGHELRLRGAAREFLYDTHEFWPGVGVHGSAPNRLHNHYEGRYIGTADYVVTVNRLIAGKLRELYGLRDKPAAVMNCPDKYSGEVRIDGVHAPVRLLYQGKVQAFRGLEELVLSLKWIDGAHLTVAGYGPLEKHLRLLAQEEGLDDRITFTGRYDPAETLSMAANHDIGVLPFKPVTLSIMYSSPNKLFDYLMSGLAVASSRLEFIGPFVDEHDIGAVFHSLVPEEIAGTLNGLVADIPRLVACKRRARELALSTYTWERQFDLNYPWKP